MISLLQMAPCHIYKLGCISPRTQTVSFHYFWVELLHPQVVSTFQKRATAQIDDRMA